MAQQTSLMGQDRYAKAGYHRKGVWRSAILAVIVLVIFVAAIVAIDTATKPQLSGLWLPVVGIILALVPAGIWLIFFYVQDRLEPEPVGYVARMFVIGLALAGAIGIPITNQVFHVQDWLYRDTMSTILGSLLIGAVEAFLIYAVVRYFMFNESEFDERMDGVVYTTAGALGYATAINIQFILSSGGNGLGGTEVYVAEVALAYAAFGGLMGYFLGHAKLERDPVWWLPLGFILTTLLNALFLVLRGQLSTGSIMTVAQSTALPSISGLVLAGILAIVVTAVVAFLVGRDVNKALKGQDKVLGDPTIGDRQANYVVIGAFVVLLIVGVLGWNGAENSLTSFNQGGVQGAYPSYYGIVSTDKDLVHVADKLGTGAEFVVTGKNIQSGQDAKSVASLLAVDRSNTVELYKVTGNRYESVNGKVYWVQDFAYVDTGGFTGSVPRVTQGTDYIYIQGTRATIITMLATPDSVGEVEPQFTQFLNSLMF